MQTDATYLPHNTCVEVRPEGGGIDSANFFAWASELVASVRDLTTNGPHVLLTYDGYATHLPICAIDLFRGSRVVIYTLPAHTSGKMQPLDVVAFSTFKRELNIAIANAFNPHEVGKLDMYHY